MDYRLINDNQMSKLLLFKLLYHLSDENNLTENRDYSDLSI